MNIADEEEKEEKGIFSSDKEELQESEDQEERMMMMTTTTTAPTSTSKLRFDNSPSPSSSTRYKDYFLSDSQNPWLPSHGSHDVHDLNNRDSPNLDLIMDLRLANNAESTENSVAAASRDSSSSSRPSSEREHLFDKVVTPSDVGKLNRLVIPKQHAEKYFPLDSSSTEKGLLLNFEDGTGKSWRFRYSYWNSSQSYVMTKGWSRFVKEKKLDAGDVVSFQRGVGEVGKHRLYIDWRRRPKAPNPLAFSQLDSQNQLRLGRLYSLPPHRTFQSLPRYLNYAGIQHPHQYQYQQQPLPMYHHQYCNYPPQDATNFENAASSQYYFMRPQGGHQIGAATLMYQHGRGGEGGGRGGHDHAPVVIDSVPVVHGRSVGKRLRLFGVNMECPIQDHDSSSSATTAQQHLVPWGPTSSGISPIPTTTTTTTMQSEISRKGKSSSLSFDLDM